MSVDGVQDALAVRVVVPVAATVVAGPLSTDQVKSTVSVLALARAKVPAVPTPSPQAPAGNWVDVTVGVVGELVSTVNTDDPDQVGAASSLPGR